MNQGFKGPIVKPVGCIDRGYLPLRVSKKRTQFKSVFQ